MTETERVPSRPTRPSARDIAAHVLARVEVDRAFAAAALDAQMEAHPQLDSRDARLATELVYGVLRTKGFLLAVLDKRSKRGVGLREPEALAHLLVAAYTLLFLERVPAFAAVSEAVEAIGRASHGSSQESGYANAVLRVVARDAAVSRPSLEDAVFESAPGWLRGALRRSIGRGPARAFLAAGPFPPPLGIAVGDPSERDAWLSKLSATSESAMFQASELSPRGIVATHAGHPKHLPGFESAWIAQEEGAQIVAGLAGAKRGERILDACAGRGNKAWTLSADVGPEGRVIAADLHPSKLARLGQRLRSRAFPSSRIDTFAVDWTLGAGDVPDELDAVLCDAPCSGTGTLRRRPEIALHRSADDIVELSALQLAISLRAATRVRMGGRFVYAVCSVLQEECEGVVARLLAATGEVCLEPAPFESPLAAGASQLKLLPQVNGTDGYFVAGFRRVSAKS